MATSLEPVGAAGIPATIDQLTEFTDQWLANRRLSDNTRAAYRRDVRRYLRWCEAKSLPPLAARFTHVNAYGRHIEAEGLADRSVARALSAISSWYDSLVLLGATPANPANGADRPRIDRDDTTTTTTGFSTAEAAAIVTAARQDQVLGPDCATALAETMVALGARVTELCLTTIGDLGHAHGHRTLRLEQMKGGRRRTRSLPPAAATAIDAMLARHPGRGNPEALLFVDAAGQPLNRHRVYRFVRRAAAAAGVPSAERITPHSFRHAWATAAEEAGASLDDQQHALGHGDPRTTQGYHRARGALDRDPSHLVAAAVAAARRAGARSGAR